VAIGTKVYLAGGWDVSGPPGFYRIDGFSPTTQDQLLPGYDQCGEYVSIPWMSVTTCCGWTTGTIR
jgi:hypothetical protein